MSLERSGAITPSPDPSPPLERSRYQLREIRGGLSARGRFRRGWFHIGLGVFLFSYFPIVALLGGVSDRWTLIAGSIVMILVGMQQASRGIDELKLARRRREYERSKAVLDDGVFD